MSKNKKESFFWTSYSDLMTSLFFVMLVLFVLTIALLHKKNEELVDRTKEIGITIDSLRVVLKRQEQLLRIDEQFKPLEESDKFVYYKDSKKFVAKDFLGIEIFYIDKSDMRPEYREKTIEIGHTIDVFLKELSKNNPELSYLLVLEGNVADDGIYNVDGEKGYILSYERALAVYKLWRSDSIDLRKYNTEVLICGSGRQGIDRDPVERNNKRFSIQIIPKISRKNEADN